MTVPPVAVPPVSGPEPTGRERAPKLGTIGPLGSLRTLRQRAIHLTELMDSPDCDPELLERTYAQFGLINTVVSRWRSTYVRQLRPHLSRGRRNTLLDIGSGGGDVARSLARWALRDGFTLDVTGIDPDPRADAFARAEASRSGLPGLTFRRAFSSELVAEGRTFDLVVSNHMLHHLEPGAFAGLLRDSEQLCRRRAVHNDIARSAAAYVLFAAGTWPFIHRSFIRADGLTTIRRSYTADELLAAVPAGWQVLPQVPYFNLLLFDKAPAEGPAYA